MPFKLCYTPHVKNWLKILSVIILLLFFVAIFTILLSYIHQLFEYWLLVIILVILSIFIIIYLGNRGYFYPLEKDNKEYYFNGGFLLPFFKCLFCVFQYLTVIISIECLCKRWKHNRVFIDLYQIIWISLLACFLFIFTKYSELQNWQDNIIYCLAFWRLFDIMVSAIRLSFFRKNNPEYPARSLILIAINYTELIFIFAILYWFNSHNNLIIFEYLGFSTRVFLPTLSKSCISLPVTYWIFMLEIFVSLIFHLTILQRVLSYFPKAK